MDRIERYRTARRDPTLAVLEGFHAVKHALRFGADLLDVVASAEAPLEDLVSSLAPDLAGQLEAVPRVPGERFRDLSPSPPPTGVIALAVRPPIDPQAALADPGPAPAVFLEEPRRLENVGAVIRVAAAAGAAGVLTSGDADPWHPTAIRGAAGLHFAIPVARVPGISATDRPLVALDPEGEELRPGRLPSRTLLALGTERAGLRPATLARADRRVRIPMRAGVSSLNLATAAAVALYLSSSP